MRIVIDVSPLSVSRTGIGNYVRGLVTGLLEVGGGRHEVVAFGLSGPRGRRRIREALAGRARRAAAAAACRAQDGGGRAGAGSDGRPSRAVVGPLDVFHFSDWMYPPQRGGAARDHGARPRAAAVPGAGRSRGTAADARAEVRERGAHVRSALRRLALHGLRAGRAPRACPRSGSPSPTPGSIRSSRPRGRGRTSAGRTSSPSRPASRARTSPTLVEGFGLLRQARPELTLALAGPRRLGAAVARGRGRAPARLRAERRAGRALPRGGRIRLPLAVRGLRHPGRRGDGLRRADGRLVRTRRSTRRAATSPCARTRTSREAFADALEQALAARRPCESEGSCTRRASPGARSARPSWPGTKRALAD